MIPVMFAVLAMPAAVQLSYADIVQRLWDLDGLWVDEPGLRSGQFSSWDRNERERWGSNGDWGRYLRVEENGEAVMAEIEGPGCVVRIWSANPKGTIRFYFDGEKKPRLELDFNRMFSGEVFPFIKPLVYKRGARMSASDCYVPIPFAKSLKITADKAHWQYYHIDYIQFPKDWRVESFRLPLEERAAAALREAARKWARRGEDPKRRMSGRRVERIRVRIMPGQRLKLAELAGPGVIRALRARVQCEQRYFWRKLVLRARWDGSRWDNILAPLGPFFGFDWQTAEYASLVAGCKKGRAYFYYPMPFRRSAVFELQSFLAIPADVEFVIEWAPVKKMPEGMLYFHARWRREPKCRTFDYPFVFTAGRGKLVGVTLQIDHPVPGWWGEGDEKVWVDGDDFPSWIGTGSEDYFGDAWGIRYLSEPSFGCSLSTARRTCPYRWHFADPIYFRRWVRMTIENYWPYEDDYSSVAYWYQAELEPPFDRLKGLKLTFAYEAGRKPERHEVAAEIFRDITEPDTRTFGRDIAFVVEGEELFEAAVRQGVAKLVDDFLAPWELNMQAAVELGRGQEVEAAFDVGEPAGSRLTVWGRPGEPVGVEVYHGAKAARKVNEDRGQGRADFDLGYLEAGRVLVRLVAARDGAMVDCVKLEQAPGAREAMEAERLAVKIVSGQVRIGREVRFDYSRGAALRMEGEEPAVVEFELLRAARRPYGLGLAALRGPDAPRVQLVVGGKAAGPAVALAARREGLMKLPVILGQVPAGTKKVRLRVLAGGKWRLVVDWLRWEPFVLGPGTVEGVYARIVRVEGCEYRIQDLWERWSGGHHLWVQPCRKGGKVDIGLYVPRGGKYRVVVRLTTSWDYAVVRVSLDGKPLGKPIDCYTPEVRQTPEIDLGVVELNAGEHVLRLEAVGKNAKSIGYSMGLDWVALRAVGR